ncbi:hypothetical protein LEP1GSC060_3449 [Leptospira weilii serovar Ranarum str. ICFT]|uniref:Uncharacterized protein n=2 Tax=Leptospira weilii TaxID=28184 RepID=N1WCT4_9LEPT|nr:hypothetical protein LEP1GSC060_3449 [Leptospira weilii serovar Ranarum str. ICFT]
MSMNDFIYTINRAISEVEVIFSQTIAYWECRIEFLTETNPGEFFREIDHYGFLDIVFERKEDLCFYERSILNNHNHLIRNENDFSNFEKRRFDQLMKRIFIYKNAYYLMRERVLSLIEQEHEIESSQLKKILITFIADLKENVKYKMKMAHPFKLEIIKQHFSNNIFDSELKQIEYRFMHELLGREKISNFREGYQQSCVNDFLKKNPVSIDLRK